LHQNLMIVVFDLIYQPRHDMAPWPIIAASKIHSKTCCHKIELEKA
jgi:hypothetical protein